MFIRGNINNIRVYEHGFIGGTRVDSKALSTAISENFAFSISPFPAVKLDDPCTLLSKGMVSKIVERHCGTSSTVFQSLELTISQE